MPTTKEVTERELKKLKTKEKELTKLTLKNVKVIFANIIGFKSCRISCYCDYRFACTSLYYFAFRQSKSVWQGQHAFGQTAG